MTLPPKPPEPTELRAPVGARVMEITWSDGHTSSYPHRLLRALCPCAYCQGHHGPIRWTEAVDTLADTAFELTGIIETGNYAIRLEWADGHGTGIYTFRYLRQLGDLATSPLDTLRGRTFER